MKTFLTATLVIVTLQINAQRKFFEKGDITAYSLSFTAGALDGFNEALWHYVPFEGRWWNPYQPWKGKNTFMERYIITPVMDADHASKFLMRSTWTLNIGLSLDDFKDGDIKRRIPKRVIGCLAACSLGHFIIHDAINWK